MAYAFGARQGACPTGAELALQAPAESWDQVHRAAYAGLHSPEVLKDPVLLDAVKQVNVENLRRWAALNLANPGERVAPRLGREAINLSRDMVRRGMDSNSLDSYRMSQSVAWRLWMDICFMTHDAAELKEVLDVSALSITTFLDDTIAELMSTISDEFDDLAQGTNAERLATLTLLLEGAPITRTQAESRLGYRIAGDHTAMVLWDNGAEPDKANPSRPARELEATAIRLAQANDCARRLIIVANARTLWVWLPKRELRFPADLEGEVQIAIGRAGNGLEGFRRTHLDATAAQRAISRISSDRRVTRFQDIQLVTLLTGDLGKAEEFVGDVLGPLAYAEPVIRETVLAYVHEQFNASRTAKRIHSYRNTVLRRLEQADQLLPRPLSDNTINIAAALEILRLHPRQ